MPVQKRPSDGISGKLSLAPFRAINVAYFSIASTLFCNARVSLSSREDGLILKEMKQGFDDPSGYFSSWNEKDDSPCNWTGIACDASHKFVVEINLANANITGPFPSVVCRLYRLKTLSLSNNYVNGSIPVDLTRCLQLEHLDLSLNLLVGSLPGFISELSRLKHLDLSGNNFSGSIPPAFGNLPQLQVLNLVNNFLDATIPAFLGNLSNLQELYLAYNPIGGALPSELGKLTKLQDLWLTHCNLVGEIPDSFGNLVQLKNLDVSMNSLSGSIPDSITKLENAEQIELYGNSLSGPIPLAIGNLKALKRLDASMNMLNGSIPEGLGSLNLESLNLYQNNLVGEIPAGLSSSTNLVELKLFSNGLIGTLPESLGRNSALRTLDIADNQFTGNLPLDLCKNQNLQILSIFSNGFSGNLPESLGRCPSLYRVRLANNKFGGTIPSSFWGLSNVSLLELANNNFEGVISVEIAKAKNLTQLNIAGNKFSGSIPTEIGELRNLTVIVASNNLLSGTLPSSLGNLDQLGKLDLHNNQLTGELLTEINSWKQLSEINLSKNRFSGSIPAKLGDLPVLTYLDLSGNFLTGPIPSELGNLKLNIFNVSDNNLSGALPEKFVNSLYEQSFVGNPGLCSSEELKGIEACSEEHRERTKRQGWWWLLRCLFALAGIILVVGLAWFYRRYRGFGKQEGKDSLDKSSWMLTSFHRLGFNEYEILDCLDEDNVIGTGGAGKVYKATLSNGETVAIKRLWSSGKNEASNDNGFQAEVETLGKIRHKNIVKLWCCCTNSDSNLLVYEYMPNGSLGDLLHGPKASVLDWPVRYKIAIGAAQGLAYLHHDCTPSIVHRDVKSNNILLDADFGARVADFGLAKILQSCGKGQDCMSAIAGSYGYIAPEYAYTLKVNEKSDIYSFGVVILELVTGKRPVDPEFGENKDLVKWVCSRIEKKNGLQEVLDPKLVDCFKEEMAMVLKVALLCTSALPINRPSMRRVVDMLQEANPHHKAKPGSKDGKLSPYYYEEPTIQDSIV
eukprot:Gb_12221 [translate_table: standard]